MLGRKSSNLEQGYVFAPYITMITSHDVFDKRYPCKLRKSKISKIFNLDYDSDLFTPSKSISSRYANKIVNSSMYGVIETTGTIGLNVVQRLNYNQWLRKLKIKNIFK
jgi:hypothetical protein